ncbi:MAG: tetratricopeptide repeat protein [Verrucomicrobia bacterium]|nr:tetratricopeptide repeat protein [Verrucomicrobiota bacterium]MBS0645648.1 tetratricopeptide repeat protein [Verrucomicrobiota bacterium]
MKRSGILFRSLTLLVSVLYLASCTRVPSKLEPIVKAPKHPKEIMREKRCELPVPKGFSVSPFEPMKEEEKQTDWGKEYFLGLAFAADFDLYRAITEFKKALFFNPPEERALEIEYAIVLSYFLGRKYTEVAYIAETTHLGKVSNYFPAFHDLVVMLYESYWQLGLYDHANNLLTMLDECDAEKLLFLSAVLDADFEGLTAYSEDKPYLRNMIEGYEKHAKSIKTAQCLNAVLPGAGYWYIGQKQTAVTALLVNSLFIGAASYFFVDGNIPAGVITLSLESGWYFGGIYGAGLATRTYNEKIYQHYAEQIGQKEQYYPLMMLKYTF